MYWDLIESVARFLGYTERPERGEVSEVQDIVESGYLWFLYPPVLPGESSPYRWNFLSPTATVTLAAGTATYSLPTDYAGLACDRFYWQADSGNNPVEIVSDNRMQALKSYDDRSGTPRCVSIRPTNFSETSGGGWEAALWPTPDAGTDLVYRYQVNVNSGPSPRHISDCEISDEQWYLINSLDTSADTIDCEGVFHQDLGPGDEVRTTNPAGDEETFTVSEVESYQPSDTETTISVAEDVTSSTPGGKLRYSDGVYDTLIDATTDFSDTEGTQAVLVEPGDRIILKGNGGPVPRIYQVEQRRALTEVYLEGDAEMAGRMTYELYSDPLHLRGDQLHQEALREACLAVAESTADDTQGQHRAIFMSRLAAAVARDRRMGRMVTLGVEGSAAPSEARRKPKAFDQLLFEGVPVEDK